MGRDGEGGRERERREKIERTEVPFAEAGAKSPLTPLRSTRLNKCIGAKKKKEKGKRAPHPPFDHYRRNWESIGHERMGSSALLLASSALSSPSAPSSPRRATIIRLSPTARWKKKIRTDSINYAGTRHGKASPTTVNERSKPLCQTVLLNGGGEYTFSLSRFIEKKDVDCSRRRKGKQFL